MELGAFSISLAVKDLAVSRGFYEKFGFKLVKQAEGAQWGKRVIEQKFELRKFQLTLP